MQFLRMRKVCRLERKLRKNFLRVTIFHGERSRMRRRLGLVVKQRAAFVHTVGL